MLFSRLIITASLVGTLAFLAGCASEPVDPFWKSADPTKAADVSRIHVGDSLTITLSGMTDEIPLHTEIVREDGSITMHEIGDVPAAGKTAGELQKSIHDLYVPKYFQHITVAVGFGDRVYYVRGEVKTPGREVYVGETTVTRAITSAGDFTDFANHNNVLLIRGSHKLRVDCDKALENPALDPVVYPGDVIQVFRRRI